MFISWMTRTDGESWRADVHNSFQSFTPQHQHETDDLSGNVRVLHTGRERAPVEVCFAYTDV
ncbi:hypothetical protein SLEP1_g19829 [Rubroshorea leprosula]|uniref:Uncharacterized protein n=1 Tax=Rubroshorea leprosula TaxID=152421 RepID=A0AAV5JCJ6_9ROSI|nr:hypothetical protein SLEP1_g19829 [Rubroshorea leprosula]